MNKQTITNIHFNFVKLLCQLALLIDYMTNSFFENPITVIECADARHSSINF